MERLKTPFRNLIQTIGSVMDPVMTLFQNIWDNVVTLFQFGWEIVEIIYFSFTTIISEFWDNFSGILGLSFFSDNSDTIAYLTSFLGISGGGLFMGLVFVIILVVVLRFIWSLVPFLRK